MTSTIAVGDLRVGMYICLEGGWLSHPFPLSSFRITSAQEISTIRGLGLERVRWEPQKSELPEAEPAPLPAAEEGSSAGGAAASAGEQAAARQRERCREVEARDLNILFSEDGSSVFFKMLSFRAIVAAGTFFGWSGLAALEGGLSTMRSFSVAFGAGLLSMYLVAWMMHILTKLHAEGNVRIVQTVGANGTVYLSIPGNREGVGKVHVNVQERTMEYDAVTADEKLPTGMPVVVVGVVDNETLEVRPAPRMEVIE